MHKKTIILTIIILSLIVMGMFTFAHLKKKEINQASLTDTSAEPQEVPYSEIVRIDAKHYFVEDKHTFAGEIILPTPCDLLNTEAFVMKSLPEQIRLDFSVINNSENCVQSLTAQRFLVSADASDQATITAYFMGREVELNLIPAAPGEIPEDFEVFIKG